MDLNGILNSLGRMFPGVNLNVAVQKAQQAISGTPNSLSGVAAAARGLGLDAQTVNEIYNKIGNSMQARAVCKMFGTTPEALKADADKIVGGSWAPPTNGTETAQTKFPRLK